MTQEDTTWHLCYHIPMLHLPPTSTLIPWQAPDSHPQTSTCPSYLSQGEFHILNIQNKHRKLEQPHPLEPSQQLRPSAHRQGWQSACHEWVNTKSQGRAIQLPGAAAASQPCPQVYSLAHSLDLVPGEGKQHGLKSLQGQMITRTTVIPQSVENLCLQRHCTEVHSNAINNC